MSYKKVLNTNRKIITLPTGYLVSGAFEKGDLEFLSIGDYGKDKNVKAQFLGLNKDIDGVSNGPCKPLSEKWVVTLSTQYGCPMKCTFCDVPKIKFKGNASYEDLEEQLFDALKLFPNVRYTERLNIHFARMGEPLFNFDNVFWFAKALSKEFRHKLIRELNLRTEVIHPVLSTCVPKAVTRAGIYLQNWCDIIKNESFNGQAGLQLSINSTNDEQRNAMFNNKVVDLDRLSLMAEALPFPLGRKYCLNFAYATGYEIDAEKLTRLFDQEKFMIKITPIHNNSSCKENGIETVEGYKSFTPYKKVEQELIDKGWDVLIFVPSTDEEKGLVTCGNAILSGSSVSTDKVRVPNILGVSHKGE